jgi:hypothetical protein
MCYLELVWREGASVSSGYSCPTGHGSWYLLYGIRQWMLDGVLLIWTAQCCIKGLAHHILIDATLNRRPHSV